MENVKLFVVTHKKVYIPDSSILIPLNPDCMLNCNIAEKQGYSELRAHYWVWKNEKVAKKVGFFQFRRYLNFTENTKIPYTIQKFPRAEDYSSEYVNRYVEPFEIVAPLPEYTGETVWQRYSTAVGHREEDLQLAYHIICKKHREFISAADAYLNGRSEYYGNLYLMNRNVFNEYCGWLFGILEEYETRADKIPARTQGYLAERLFGIWFTKVKLDGFLKWKEVPRVHFWGYDDETHHIRRDKFINLLLPPGSERRALIKSLTKGGQ